ncbi:AMP-binding protein [Streptomyces sp. NPDC051561]|uniref:AMP-binding protein n=1 Tax=Streptomyces sp. NPDC051561 TaxID=3365658 RepID=UPI00379773F2
MSSSPHQPPPSPTPPLSPRTPPATLAALPQYAADAYGQREALADGEVRWTFTRLNEEIAAATRAALAHGVRRGDRVAVWAPNSRQWITAALGAVCAGGVLVPVNTRYKAAEAADIIRRSGASVLLTERGFLGTDYVAALHASGEDLGALRSTVVLRGEPGSQATGWDGYLAAGARVGDTERLARIAEVAPENLSDILYTSGTTGRPKGVTTTHSQTVRLFGDWSRLVTLREGDRYLLVNPFFHTFGYKAGIIACLLRGATMLPESVYDADRILKRMAAEQVTTLMGPPTVFHGLLHHPERAAHDLSALRLAGTGAAAVPTELVEQIRNSLGAPDVFTAYGLTESGGVVSVCPTDADAWTVAHTVGLPLPGTEVRIADPLGDALPPGDHGEVQVRGYHVMRGYLDDAAATAEAVLPDGWLRTGDIGFLDARGFLVITDRLKDMYVVGGFNAYPAEVENVLLGHEAIADVAVVGAPDARLGEVGVAFFVTNTNAATTTAANATRNSAANATTSTADNASMNASPGTPTAGAHDVSPEALTAWTRERLANFKVPRRFVPVESLPRNAGGKLLKGELRRAARGEDTPGT